MNAISSIITYKSMYSIIWNLVLPHKSTIVVIVPRFVQNSSGTKSIVAVIISLALLFFFLVFVKFVFIFSSSSFQCRFRLVPNILAGGPSHTQNHVPELDPWDPNDHEISCVYIFQTLAHKLALSDSLLCILFFSISGVVPEK